MKVWVECCLLGYLGRGPQCSPGSPVAVVYWSGLKIAAYSLVDELLSFVIANL